MVLRNVGIVYSGMRRHNPEDLALNLHLRENLKPCNAFLNFKRTDGHVISVKLCSTWNKSNDKLHDGRKRPEVEE